MAEQERTARFDRRSFQILYKLFYIDPNEHWLTLKMLMKWTILGGLVGIVAGTASALFLAALTWATNTQIAHPWLLYFLPLGGLVIGWIYLRYGGTAALGNNLIIEELHVNRAPIPARMAPLVLLGTVTTHLFGGSAGREGTAIQMSGSLADWLWRSLKLSQDDRKLMLMAGISGGFSSVFGTPVAGFVFGMEVQSIGRVNYEGIIPCLVAAIVGDMVTRAWGIQHSLLPPMAQLETNALLLIKVVAAGIVFGVVSLLFIELTHAIKRIMKQRVNWPPLRPVLGGLAVIALVYLVGTQDYLGLSLVLIQDSLNGQGVVTFAFLLKLIFTAVTLGSGFMGGEVTPLFVIGATLGYSLARLLGIDTAFLASIGFVAVLAGASNTPLACTLMGLELFGGGSALYLILGTFVAYLASGQRSIYTAQRVSASKVPGLAVSDELSLETLHEQHVETV